MNPKIVSDLIQITNEELLDRLKQLAQDERKATAIIELRCRAHNGYEAELDFGASVRRKQKLPTRPNERFVSVQVCTGA